MQNVTKAIQNLSLVGAFAIAFGFVTSGALWAQSATLYMVEQAGCIYCTRWHAEVGDAYHLTAEGRAAPLQPIDLRDDPPEGVSFARRAVFTPTFILVQDGHEIARLEGYPGEDFFWPLLTEMLTDAGIPLD